MKGPAVIFHTINIIQDVAYGMDIEWIDTDGTAMDMADWDGAMEIRDERGDGSVVLTADTSNSKMELDNTEGIVKIRLAVGDYDTLAANGGRFMYDVYVWDGTKSSPDDSRRLARGPVKLVKGITASS